ASGSRHGQRNRIRKRQFLVVRATQKPSHHFEALVIEFEFLSQIRSVHQQVKMIRLGQSRIVRVAPTFSIESQPKNKIRMQFEIHHRRPAPNLAVAVEQNFTLPTDRLLLRRISRIKNIGARLWHAILNENFSGERAKIIRTLAGRWLNGTSDKRNFRTKLTQS